MTTHAVDVHPTYRPTTRRARCAPTYAAGLTAHPKWLPPKWFYDARGSELFEDITRLPEYYPTRAEREILQPASGEIAARERRHTLVELGSGSSEKTRLLLDALRDRGTLRAVRTAGRLAVRAARGGRRARADYPALRRPRRRRRLHQHLDALPGDAAAPRRVPRRHDRQPRSRPSARPSTPRSASVLEPGEWLLLGTDLVKDPETWSRAYDDAQA